MSDAKGHSLRLYYLQQMGIEPWLLRNNQEDVGSSTKWMVIIEPLDDNLSHKSQIMRLLQRMITSIGLSDQDVSVHTFVNNPLQHIELIDQIAAVKPCVIIAMGSSVLQWFMTHGTPLQNGMHDYEGTPVCMSYHPAHLLKNTSDKRTAYSRLLQVRHMLVSQS